MEQPARRDQAQLGPLEQPEPQEPLERLGQLALRAQERQEPLDLVRLAQLDPLDQQEPLGWALLVQRARKAQLDLMAQLEQQDL